MMIQIPPRDSYDVETGRYRATCIDAKEIQKQTRKGSEKFLRLTWELQIPSAENVRYLAGKSYEPTLTKNSELRNDLRNWLGHDFKAGKFDTATLRGLEATITMLQIENEGWPKPYCLVAKVEPQQRPPYEFRPESPKRLVFRQMRLRLCRQSQASEAVPRNCPFSRQQPRPCNTCRVSDSRSCLPSSTGRVPGQPRRWKPGP